MRAWTGRNAEVTAELHITATVEKGLRALLGSARTVEAPETEYSPEAATLEEEALEQARAQVAARWAASLNIGEEGACLIHQSERYPTGPHPDGPEIVLEVGTLLGELVAWPAHQVAIQLGRVPPAECSELVRLRVSREGKSLAWLQRAPVTPPFGVERDRAAFVRMLGARGFLLWLAGLLAEGGGQDESDWLTDTPRKSKELGAHLMLDASLPTLEEMLAAWARDPKKFREIEQRVSQYLPAVLEQAKEEEAETADMLRRFDDLWCKLRNGLGIVESKGIPR
jgi:hypothetical protein